MNLPCLAGLRSTTNGDQVGPDAGEVQQRVALGGGAVGGDRLAAGACASIRKASEVVLDLLGARLEACVERGACVTPAAASRCEQRADRRRLAAARRRRCAARRRAGCRRASAAPRRRRPRRPLAREDALHRASATGTRSARGRWCRTGSPRPAAAGAGTRRSRRRAASAARAKPATKSLMSGTCASTLLAAIRSAWRPCGGELARPSATPKNSLDDLDALARAPPRRCSPSARCRGTGCRARCDVLQQVAVVGGDLDDEAVAAPRPKRAASPST